MQVHDVMVIGAGLSGASAAVLLAREGHDVVLLERRPVGELDGWLDWISPHGLAILQELGASAERIGSTPLNHCTFHLADWSRSIQPVLPEPAAGLLDYPTAVRVLLELLGECPRAQCIDGADVARITPGENQVKVQLADHRLIQARLALVASGGGIGLLDDIGLTLRGSSDAGTWQATSSGRLPQKVKQSRMDVVLGVGGATGLALRLARGDQVCVSVTVPGSARVAEQQLQHVAGQFQRVGLLPDDWFGTARASRGRWVPAGAALEMDNHVAKLSAAIGEAGGFVCSFTGEGIYPGMWSAQLAAAVFGQALRSKRPQDQLREFDRVWRMSMAEYLRAPQADAKSILPMVFSNQQMADRMLASILLGSNF